MEFTILMLFGVLTAVVVLVLAAGMQERGHRGSTVSQSLLRDVHVLAGEALFATGIDSSTVVFDCLVAPRPETSGAAALFRPLPVRAHQVVAEDQPPLSVMVRSWADGGHRVFIELPALAGELKAKLSCGGEAVVVDVDNDAEVWRALTAVG